MKSYILSVITAAVFCAAVRTLLPTQTAAGRLVRLLSGVLMAITVIAPLANFSFDRIGNYFDTISAESNVYISEGESVAQESISAVIKKQAESYILDKATRMGLTIAVEVEVDAGNHSIPCGVTISGQISPYAREQMREFLEDTLGIPKENQKWI